MAKGSARAGGVLCWPENNYYFRLGVDALLEQTRGLNPERLLFIHLCGRTLKPFLLAFPAMLTAMPEREIFIIASPRLIPLARHWAGEK